MICDDCINLREVHSDHIVCNIQQPCMNKNIIDCSFYEKKDCCNCKYHNYDWNINDGYGGDEYEVCDKGHDLEPESCKDFEEL